MRQNPVPETHVTLCSSEDGSALLHLNIHLRASGVDARFVSHRALGHVVNVPPADRGRAQELRDAYALNPTDWRDDWAKLKTCDGFGND